ncbi:MAG: TlpA disulfide reductase family protein [Planctomycetota bacterium]|nr:TlpA disulfide reductase family protein [Planctomycetota bacterium]MDA1106218.1 TlpA disulfide reductase family protein [Planctomycetota bacterium]
MRNTAIISALATTTALLVASATWAQQIDEAAKATYETGIAAVRALKSVEMTTAMTVKGIEAGMVPADFGAPTVFACEFTDGGQIPIGRLFLAPTGADPAWRCAFDGKEAILVETAAKEYKTSSGDMWVFVLGQHMSSIPQWIFETRMMDPAQEGAPTLTSASNVGTETLDGVECQVVKIERAVSYGEEDEAEKLTITETIAFGTGDSLPRRVELVTTVSGDPTGGMAMVSTFTGVKANPALESSMFSTTAPEGFTKAAEPEAGAEMSQPELKFKVGDAAPEFTLKTIAGEEVSLASLKGKVVLLDFWATWCGPCKAAMPEMQKIADDYKDKGVVVYGINVWEKKEDAAKKYIESKGFTYPTLLSGDDLAKQYGITSIPTLVVIGKDGKIAKTEVGFGGAEALRKAIDEAVAAVFLSSAN